MLSIISSTCSVVKNSCAAVKNYFNEIVAVVAGIGVCAFLQDNGGHLGRSLGTALLGPGGERPGYIVGSAIGVIAGSRLTAEVYLRSRGE